MCISISDIVRIECTKKTHSVQEIGLEISKLCQLFLSFSKSPRWCALCVICVSGKCAICEHCDWPPVREKSFDGPLVWCCVLCTLFEPLTDRALCSIGDMREWSPLDSTDLWGLRWVWERGQPCSFVDCYWSMKWVVAPYRSLRTSSIICKHDASRILCANGFHWLASQMLAWSFYRQKSSDTVCSQHTVCVYFPVIFCAVPLS